ncbi:MAG: hypothetical protein Fur0021_02460 [Candidatus Promineifilaceae bacterium]
MADAAPPPDTSKITPELVRQVAGRVYALWLRDLQIEQERRRWQRPSSRVTSRRKHG